MFLVFFFFLLLEPKQKAISLSVALIMVGQIPSVEVLCQNAFYIMEAVVKLLSRKAIASAQYMRISVFPYPWGIISVFYFCQFDGLKKKISF